ncbi:MAG: hypothetical protein GXP19_09135 [Gammaproteobacteria bacterium]|nr:hypothetical protein [Gammaproteobacteria bacterium]
MRTPAGERHEDTSAGSCVMAELSDSMELSAWIQYICIEEMPNEFGRIRCAI